MAPTVNRYRARRRSPRIGLFALGVLIVTAGLLAVVIVAPPRLIHMRQPATTGLSAADRARIEAQFETDRTKAENDLRGTLLTTLAGVAVATGTVVAALNFSLQRRGQVTERFTKAIDQLGARGVQEAERLDIRIGGIYALEQIARDSPDLHWPIVEILTAFIREHTKPEARSESASEKLEGKEASPANRKVPADIQAALTVLGRRNVDNDRGRVDLIEAKVEGANLRQANLQGANLGGADLQGADLQGADLTGANLEEADLRGARLTEANFEKTRLGWAILQGADLYRANLQNAYIPQANLEGASLIETNLQGALLSQVNLEGADLSQANLQGAHLREATLQGANLDLANLHRAWLGVANLRGVTGLTQAQLDSAEAAKETQLPPGLTTPRRWR